MRVDSDEINEVVLLKVTSPLLLSEPKVPVPETESVPVSVSPVQVRPCKLALPCTVRFCVVVFPLPSTKNGKVLPLYSPKLAVVLLERKPAAEVIWFVEVTVPKLPVPVTVKLPEIVVGKAPVGPVAPVAPVAPVDPDGPVESPVTVPVIVRLLTVVLPAPLT